MTNAKQLLFTLLCVFFSIQAARAGADGTILVDEVSSTLYIYPSQTPVSTNWSCSSNVAFVETDKTSCRVRGVSPGSATIYAECHFSNGSSFTYHLLVDVLSDKPEYLTLSVKTLEIDEGVERTITASPDHSRATNYTLTWSAVSYGGAQSDVVKIINQSKESCTFKAMKAGEAYVKATTNNGVSASCYVSVFGINPESMSISGPETLYVGNSDELKMYFTPNSHHSKLTWTSNNEEVVSVGYSTGKVWANAIGTAIITAKSANGLEATHKIEVKEQPITIVRTFPEKNFEQNVPLNVIPTIEFAAQDIAINYAYPGFDSKELFKMTAMDGTIVVAHELIQTKGSFQIVPNRTLRPGLLYKISVPAGYLKILSTGEISQQDFTFYFSTTKEGEGGITGSVKVQDQHNGISTCYAPAVATVNNNSLTECTGYVKAEFYHAGDLRYSLTSNTVVIPAGKSYTAYLPSNYVSNPLLMEIVATFYAEDGETVPLGKTSVTFHNYNKDNTSGYPSVEDTDYYDEVSDCYYTPLDNNTCYLKRSRSNYRSGNIVIPTEINGHKVVGIGNRSFYFVQPGTFESLTIELPSTIEWIAAEAFSSCFAKKITLSDGLKYIGINAFGMMPNLAEISLPDGIAKVADEAFKNCSNLATLKIPHNSFETGSYIWFNCTNLESVYNYNTEPQSISIYNFYNGDDVSSNKNALNTKITVYVPQGTKQFYSQKAGWSRFGQIDKIVEFDAGVTPTLTMTSVTPMNNATSISVNIVPQVRFSADVALAVTQPGYDNEFITLKDEDGNEVLTQYAAQVYDNIVRLTPIASLRKGTRYTFFIGAGQIKKKNSDIVNNEDISFSFTTMEGKQLESLELVKTEPEDGAINVPLNVHPTMHFSTDARTYRNTDYSKIKLTKDDGTEIARGPLCSGNGYWIEPNEPLEPNTHYTFTIGAGVFYDPATVSPTKEDFSFSFTTVDPTGIQTVGTDTKTYDIYNLQGHKIRSKVSTTDGLSKGIYIINGKKMVVQ